MRSKKFTVKGVEVTVSTGKNEDGNAAIILSTNAKRDAVIKTVLVVEPAGYLDQVFDRVGLSLVTEWVSDLMKSPISLLLETCEEDIHANAHP